MHTQTTQHHPTNRLLIAALVVAGVIAFLFVGQVAVYVSGDAPGFNTAVDHTISRIPANAKQMVSCAAAFLVCVARLVH